MRFLWVIVFSSATVLAQNQYGPDYITLHTTNVDPLSNLSLNNPARPGLVPSASLNGTAIIYLDTGAACLKVSTNGGAYACVGGGLSVPATLNGTPVAATFNGVTNNSLFNGFYTSTQTSGNAVTGFNQVANLDPAGSSSNNYYSYAASLSIPATNSQNFSSNLIGYYSLVQQNGSGNLTYGGAFPALTGFGTSAIHNGSGTISQLAGVHATATNNAGGTVTSQSAIRGVSGLSNTATGTTTNDNTFLASAPGLSASGGVMTHHYGFHCNPGQTGGTSNSDGWCFFSDPADKSQLGLTTVATLGTVTNCAANSASPAVCGSSASGAFVVPTTTTTYTVNSTAVTSASRIFLFPTTDASNLPSTPTCVAPAAGTVVQSARVAATSFTFTLPSTTGTTCFNYLIVN